MKFAPHIALAIGAAIAPFATPALAQSDPDAIIRIGSLYEPQNLDNTAGAGQGINEAFNDNVYEGLFRLTDEGDVEPVLAADHTISDDGLTHRFTLEDGVTFHSGDPLTAEDVKYSIERVIAEDSQSSRKSSLAPIESIETPDDRTVVVNLSEKSISLPYNLTYVWIVNDAAGDISSSEDGTGPYTLADWRRGSALSLERFDDYWGEARKMAERCSTFLRGAALDNALLTDAVDLITSVQSECAGSVRSSTIHSPRNSTTKRSWPITIVSSRSVIPWCARLWHARSTRNSFCRQSGTIVAWCLAASCRRPTRGMRI